MRKNLRYIIVNIKFRIQEFLTKVNNQTSEYQKLIVYE